MQSPPASEKQLRAAIGQAAPLAARHAAELLRCIAEAKAGPVRPYLALFVKQLLFSQSPTEAKSNSPQQMRDNVKHPNSSKNVFLYRVVIAI